ncbi:unnamed protein product [Arabidopsis lyrata]|nr:unnamed protein product [Arabidopsis lyrata]
MGNVMGKNTKIPPLKLGVPVELRIGVGREGGRPRGVGIWSSEAKSCNVSCALIAYYVLKKLGVHVGFRIGVGREGGGPGVVIWSSEAKSTSLAVLRRGRSQLEAEWKPVRQWLVWFAPLCRICARSRMAARASGAFGRSLRGGNQKS